MTGRSAPPLVALVATRVAVVGLTLMALSVVIFWSTEMLPGDAAGVLSGADATAAEREAVRQALGLDQPPATRYVTWAGGMLHGDFGTSLISGREIAPVVTDRLGNTLTIVAVSITVIAVLAVTVGLVAGMHAGRSVDRVLSSATILVIAIPDFLLATLLLVLFASFIPLFPAVALIPLGDSIWQHPEVLVLPAAALVLGGVGGSMRMVRAAVIGVAESAFVEYARLNGAHGVRLAVAHVLPNAAGPAVQALAIMTAGLLGGGIIVETLFNVPGIGLQLSTAVADRDVPMVQALSLVLGATALLVLFAGDLVAAVLSRQTGVRTGLG